MNKILVLGSGVFTLAAAGLMLVPSLAQAQSGYGNMNGNGGGRGYQQSLTSKAEVLGMTSEELRTELESKTLLEIATEKGVSEDKLHAAIQASAQKRWAANGLSQSEIDSRLKDMTERQANCDGTGNGGGQHYRGNR
jgi:hypothetical protein